MMVFFFDDEIFQKKNYKFVDVLASKQLMQKLKLDSKEKVYIKDKSGVEREVEFYVTRDARLGGQRWIYGRVISDTGEDEYYQIEIKLHREESDMDSIEVFRRAPPSHVKSSAR